MDTFRLPSPPPQMKLSIALNSFMFNSVAPVSQCSPQSVHRLSLLSMSWTGTENWISPRLSRRRHGTGTQIFGQYSTYWSVSSSVACPCSQARLYLGGTWNATKYSVKLTIVFIHYFLTARSQVFKPRFFIIFMASQSVSREILITKDWKELKPRKQGNFLTSHALLTLIFILRLVKVFLLKYSIMFVRNFNSFSIKISKHSFQSFQDWNSIQIQNFPSSTRENPWENAWFEST